MSTTKISRNGRYGARPIKRFRRTKADMDRLRRIIVEAVEADAPMTVRQVFYRLVVLDAIDKTERGYSVVVRLLTNMRRSGELDFDLIADNTRWMRKPRTFSSMESLLNDAQHTYRRAIWDGQKGYVEIWLEKEALAGVLYEITQQWDVPLMVTRGYPSVTFLHSAAETIRHQEKPTYLYYFGDHDPSGVDIPRFVESELRSHGVDFTFSRVAVVPEQIKKFKLPTRPTKKNDVRSTRFKGRSVEVDAIPPKVLREICEESIVQHLNKAQYRRTLQVEAAERETLKAIASKWEEGASA